MIPFILVLLVIIYIEIDIASTQELLKSIRLVVRFLLKKRSPLEAADISQWFDLQLTMLESVLETQTKSILNTNGYNTVRRLGKGGFGHVLLATKSTSSTTCFAVKCISKKKMIKDQQLKRFLLQEINTMAILNHPNIVKLLKTFEEGDWYFLVLEYCDMGNLYNYVSKSTHRALSLQESIVVFKQVLRGVQEIHSKHIIHRDIKLQNILLKRNSKGGYTCKIGDFGLARPIDNNETAVTNCGTEIYMAPEILSGQAYGKQADIWSMGVLFYYLLFADFPFKGINILDEIKTRCKGGFKLAQGLNSKAITKKKEEMVLADFFSRIFEIEPSKRLTILQIMHHDLIKEQECKIAQQSPNTTTTEEEQDNLLQWQCSRIQFIQKIVETVVSFNFLSFYLITAFKFYINKVLLYFLNRNEVKILREAQGKDQRVTQLVNQLENRIMEQLSIQYSLLIKNQHHNENIQRFEDGFNTKIEDFVNFKMAYRNTVGKVYEEAHKKLADNLQDRAALKLKLFFCHIINRVFSGTVNVAIFPYYVAWLKRNGMRVPYRYDFGSIEEWIRNERPENLQRSQDTINQMFYK